MSRALHTDIFTVWAILCVQMLSIQGTVVHDDYFNMLSEYFNFSFNDDQSAPHVDVDPFGCLRYQRLHGWDTRVSISPSSRPPVVELVGIEGVGHHAMHAMFDQSDKGENDFRFTGSSWPATSKWREDECPLESNIRSRPLHVFGAKQQLPGEQPGLYVVLVRAPGAAAVSAMARFDHIGKATELGSENLAQADAARRLRMQRDTQFESLAVLSAYVRSLPCNRVVIVPLEVLSNSPHTVASVLVSILAPLLSVRVEHGAMLRYAIDAVKPPSKSSLSSPRSSGRRLRRRRPPVGVKDENDLGAGAPMDRSLAKELLRHEIPDLEKFFLRYRQLWPLLAPSEVYLQKVGKLESLFCNRTVAHEKQTNKQRDAFKHSCISRPNWWVPEGFSHESPWYK